jgi:hypothetical protein
MKLYLNAFLVGTIGMAVVGHFVAKQLPWWPDAFIFGVFWGSVAALSLLQHGRYMRRAWTFLKGSLPFYRTLRR